MAVKKYIGQLGIKKKSVRNTVYIKDTLIKRDTLILKDTAIVEAIDTVIGDSFVRTNIKLTPPDNILISTCISNEKVVVFSERKEVLNPSKLFFIRWFQKRVKFIKVDISNTNPYIRELEGKSIEYKTQ
jgi:hypothetical protein